MPVFSPVYNAASHPAPEDLLILWSMFSVDVAGGSLTGKSAKLLLPLFVRGSAAFYAQGS